MGQPVAAVYAPPGWAGAIGRDQAGLDIAPPLAVPNGVRNGHMLGIGEHRCFGEDRLKILVQPRAAVIPAVMIGQCDEIHRSSPLLLGHFCEILCGAEKGRCSGSIIDGSFEVAIRMGDHDDILIRHSLELSDNDVLFEVRVLLDVPAHTRLEADAIGRCIEFLDGGPILVSDGIGWES